MKTQTSVLREPAKVDVRRRQLVSQGEESAFRDLAVRYAVVAASRQGPLLLAAGVQWRRRREALGSVLTHTCSRAKWMAQRRGFRVLLRHAQVVRTSALVRRGQQPLP